MSCKYCTVFLLISLNVYLFFYPLLILCFRRYVEARLFLSKTSLGFLHFTPERRPMVVQLQDLGSERQNLIGYEKSSVVGNSDGNKKSSTAKGALSRELNMW